MRPPPIPLNISSPPYPQGLTIVRADNSAIVVGTTEIPIAEQIKITTPNQDADYTIKFKLKEYSNLEGNEQFGNSIKQGGSQRYR